MLKSRYLGDCGGEPTSAPFTIAPAELLDDETTSDQVDQTPGEISCAWGTLVYQVRIFRTIISPGEGLYLCLARSHPRLPPLENWRTKS